MRWKFDQPSPLLQTESQKLFLKLLSHPSPPVKTETYECTLNLVKDCLGIQNLSREKAAASAAVKFLLHHQVLYEISAFGLQDSAEKVNVAAKDILLFLLKGRLMMTAPAWDRFNEALYPVIPIIQVLFALWRLQSNFTAGLLNQPPVWNSLHYIYGGIWQSMFSLCQRSDHY
ncbi:hypothetical protein XENORESO_021401 [Xenotaenia resolanae]|uniref:Uncharacterized protein n=1 Tax=Xenotaenia resolanae TaxID=208358 RepID=A0ABV0VML0_9TELE